VVESAFIECIAQTVAAALGYRERQKGKDGKPTQGMLAAVSNFKIEGGAPLDATLQISVKELKRLGPMLMVSGAVMHEGRLIASGELSLYA
jgi:predicted hotdog family 3-hydroxylacyl-ACP dehydratase